MQILLDNVLDVHTLEAINKALNDEALYEDGRRTAGRIAKKVKNNLQAKASETAVIGAQKIIEKRLLEHPVFRAASQIKKFAKVMFSRYQPGMHYGTHIDDAIIANARTDISFTLFLSDPESYEGGELALSRHDGEELIKPPAGSLFMYPTTQLHRVSEVTSGTRLAAVGWIQSRVRSTEQRETIFDLHKALAELPDTQENQLARLYLLKIQSNLIRAWGD